MRNQKSTRRPDCPRLSFVSTTSAAFRGRPFHAAGLPDRSVSLSLVSAPPRVSFQLRNPGLWKLVKRVEGLWSKGVREGPSYIR